MARSMEKVDVDAVLDRVRSRGLPLIVLISSAVTLVLDGFDMQVIGFVAPILTAEFDVERGALAPVLAASLIGMGLGALIVGPIGDRVGRKNALLISILMFGANTLLASTAHSLPLLAFWRLLTGLGLGGALPNAMALMGEFSPPSWRSQAMAASIVGVPAGGMIGAAISAELLPLLGWRALFAFGGLLPLVWLAVIYFILPESPRYLATRHDKRRELVAILNRIEGMARYSGSETFFLGSSSGQRPAAGIGALFMRDLVRDTLAAWLIFSTNVFAIFAFFNWGPVVIKAFGFDLETAVRGSFVFNLYAAISPLVLSWAIPRFGSRRRLIITGVLAMGSVLYLAWLAQIPSTNADRSIPITALMAGLALAGLMIGAIQGGMYVVSAHIYPTECRASGVGWAVGIGRLGGIFSSFVSALLLASKARETGYFVGIAAALVLTTFGLAILRRHIPAPSTNPINEFDPPENEAFAVNRRREGD
jgi:MFS transporter, AAHS family, 4-hydroxybenzoate transporter